MKIVMPTFIEMGMKKKKKYSISLNIYRNLHYIVSNKLKSLYKGLVKTKLKKFNITKLNTPISITYIFFNGTRRKSDVSNFISIQKKFFEDALVELGYIKDDNYDYIIESHEYYGGYDKGKQRVEIIITQM